MKVYIAGPMTGLPQNNFPAFDAAAAVLRAQGHEVISPAELDDPEDRELALNDQPATKTWGDFLARDVKLIADAGIEAIVLLPGWEKSRGARLEATVGLLNGLKFFTYVAPSPPPVTSSYGVATTIQGSFL
jgi:hypothetical protein